MPLASMKAFYHGAGEDDHQGGVIEDEWTAWLDEMRRTAASDVA